MTTHFPKGGMCMTCSSPRASCGTLPFDTMPIIKTYPDGTKAVKCSGYIPAPKALPPVVRWLPADDTEGGTT